MRKNGFSMILVAMTVLATTASAQIGWGSGIGPGTVKDTAVVTTVGPNGQPVTYVVGYERQVLTYSPSYTGGVYYGGGYGGYNRPSVKSVIIGAGIGAAEGALSTVTGYPAYGYGYPGVAFPAYPMYPAQPLNEYKEQRKTWESCMKHTKDKQHPTGDKEYCATTLQVNPVAVSAQADTTDSGRPYLRRRN